MSQARYQERRILFAAEAIGVIIASLLCALLLPHRSFEEYLLAAVIVAVLLGVPIAVVLHMTFPKTILPTIYDWSSSRDQRARAALGQPPRKEGDPVEVERVFDVDLPVNSAFERALVGVKSIPRCRRLTADSEALCIDAAIGMTWKTFGERVSVKVNPTGDTTSRIRIQSRPRIQRTVFDYGTNGRNVEQVARHVTRPVG